MSTHDDLFARAQALLPGGVTSPVRAFRSVGGTPRYVKSAHGAILVGVDREHWVDFCLGWGPLILGHAHPRVVEAVQRAAADGLCFGTVSRGELELAERILAGYPRFGRVRLTCSGTESVLTALRLVRGATGRPLILKFAGCYHGHVDAMLVKGGSGLVSFGIGDSAGLAPGATADTLVLPLDDEAALDEAFRAHGDRIAAAIVEPVPANNGLLVQRRPWLERLRALTRQHGALLIFDEVITGFRFGYGGAERILGVEPDLVTLGKIVGGGLPLAAVAGPPALLDQLAPAGSVYQAGTMAGNPVAVAAGIATLDELRGGEVYAHLEGLSQRLGELAPRWVRVGPVFWPWLGEGEAPRTDAAIPASVREPYGRFFHAALDAGIYLPPSAFEVGFLCAAHTVGEIERLVGVAESVGIPVR